MKGVGGQWRSKIEWYSFLYSPLFYLPVCMNDDAIGRAQISYHSIVQLRPLPFSLYFNKFYYCKLNRKCISHARGYHPSPFECLIWFLNSPICEWLLISYCGISGGHNAERRLSPTNDERNNYSPTAPWGWGRSPKERRLLHLSWQGE